VLALWKLPSYQRHSWTILLSARLSWVAARDAEGELSIAPGLCATAAAIEPSSFAVSAWKYFARALASGAVTVNVPWGITGG
jgi:hypothetical protein